jgi:hypothetical protein
MTKDERELVALTNQQYEALIKMQMESYKNVLEYCKDNIGDSEIVEIIDNNISEIEKTIAAELEEIKADNKKFIDTI